MMAACGPRIISLRLPPKFEATQYLSPLEMALHGCSKQGTYDQPKYLVADSRRLTEAWQVIHSMLGDQLSHGIGRKALGGNSIN